MSEFFANSAVVLPVLVPLLGAAITVMLAPIPRVRRTVMEVSVALMFLASLNLLWRVAGGEVFVMAFGGWTPPFGVSLVGDRLSAAASMVTAMVAGAVAIYSRADIRKRRRRAGFDPMFLAMLVAVNGAFLTGDVFNMYVWFELMLVTALGLITLDRRRTQIDGAIRYAAMSMVGATFILLGVGLLYAELGTLDIRALSSLMAEREPTLAISASAFLLVAGFGLKAGLFPFFFWLPASYHTAPISVMALLAGLLTKVGFYACMRIVVMVFGVGSATRIDGLTILLAVVASSTMLVAVIIAMAQTDIRRLLSYHVLAQVAYLVLGLAVATTLGVAAAIVYMLHTILVQTGLFMGAGAIARANGSYDLQRGGGLMRQRPLLTILFALPMFSVAGIPPLSGFWAKFLVIDAAFRAGYAWMAIVAIVAAVLTINSISSFWTQAFWQTPVREHAIRPIPVAMMVGLALMGASTLVMGVAIDPVASYAREAAAQMMPAMLPASLP